MQNSVMSLKVANSSHLGREQGEHTAVGAPHIRLVSRPGITRSRALVSNTYIGP